MTQRERVLQMLREAGPKGIRSDECIKDFMPRAAARVQELKDEGYEISSEREGKYTRWTLTNVGVESDGLVESQPEGQGLADNRAVTLDSGVAASSPPLAPASEAHARNPYEYELMEGAA